MAIYISTKWCLEYRNMNNYLPRNIMWDPFESKNDHLTPAKIQYFQLLKLNTQRSTFTFEVLETAIIITVLILQFL